MDEQREYPFEFSVVMAVYNVEPFLREAVDSLIQQDFGFERIQLIMVDDGSTDGSGAICDEYAAQYPENVMVIHKENGGVASARNEGLKYATGRYLNFMDSDDKFTENVMSEIHRYFSEWEEETDVLTIPLQFFDALNEPHWQNEKFNKGAKVLDLFWDYQASIMFVNASFFAGRVKEKIKFDSHLVCGEDIKVLLTILADKMKLGVVPSCKYMYRRRSGEGTSLVQTAKKKYGWYFDYFTYLVDWALTFYKECFGYVPAFLQYELMADLQWRFRQVNDMTPILTKEEIEQYKIRLFESLKNFDDEYILNQKMLWAEHKCYVLAKKYGHEPELTSRKTNMIVHFGNTKINSIAEHYSMIEFLKISNGELIIEGYTKIFGVTLEEPLEVFLKVNNELCPCEIIERELINEYRFEELIFRGIGFRCSIPLDPAEESYEIKVVLRCRGTDIEKRDIRLGQFMPISKKYKSSYYFSGDWVAQLQENTLQVDRCGRRGHMQHELQFLKELWKENEVGGRKAVLARLAYHVLKRLKRKPIWLISDRIGKADDNGEALFRYLRENHAEEVGAYFVISKKCKDYDRLRKIGPVVNHLSWKHKMLHLLCRYNISAQADELVINPFYGYSYYYQDLLAGKKFIFLQHGITKDNLSSWLNRFNKNISLFVTAACPEYQSVLGYNYHYSEKIIKLTGFPRYDRLYSQKRRKITIMPTWRAYLVAGSIDPKTGKRELNAGFQKSQYFAMYNTLLNERRLFDAAQKLGYTIEFLNHPNMGSTTDEMTGDQRLRLWGEDTPYRDVFAQSDLVVTDYSSVAFDFAYLRKPVVYYQADKDEFFSGAHTYQKGYFDYEKDGFGEVEYSVEALVDRIIEYMENGCRLKEKYRERIDQFFAFNDKNNCQRVYEKIMELEGEA